MTTYYKKAAEVLDQAIYDVNPAMTNSWFRKLGRLQRAEVKDPWNVPAIHYNAYKDAVNAHFGITPEYADAEGIPAPAMAIPVWATWSVQVPDSQMRSIAADPQGQISQMVQRDILNQQGYYLNILERNVANYLSTANPTTNPNYIADYVGVFSAQAATGTATKPEDVNSTAGTITATGIKTTGAGMDVDALEKAFHTIADRFLTQIDTTTFKRMGHTNSEGDRVSLFLNPEVWRKIERGYVSNASGELDYSQNIGAKLREAFDVELTYAFDASYDMAAATVSEYGMGLNISENFVWQELVPYTISEWEEFKDPKSPTAKVWRKWGGMRFICFPIPMYINSTWKKAFTHASFIPYATS